MTRQRIARTLVAVFMAVASLQITGMEAADAAALTNVSWSVDQAHPSQAGTRYTWSFTTATTGTIATVTFSVPAGTAAGGGVSVVDYYGITVGTAALAANTVTYTVTTPASIASGTPIMISLGGFTNTGTPGTYQSTVTTQAAGPATIDGGTASNNVVFDDNTTDLTVVIARTITFAKDVDTILLLMDPSIAALTDRSHSSTNLDIATNAANGYTLYANASDLTGTGDTIARLSAGTGTGYDSATFAASHKNTWGFRLPAAPTSGSATGAGSMTRLDDLAADEWVGHTLADQDIVTQSEPTNGDDMNVDHRVVIDYLQAAKRYDSTITYTATPGY